MGDARVSRAQVGYVHSRQVVTSQREIRSSGADPDESVRVGVRNPYVPKVRAIVITSLLLALALPATAAAQSVPPGNSGIDQYQESIPGVGGNKPTNGPGATGSGGDAPSVQTQISPSTVRKLDKLGPAGKETAAAAAATAQSAPNHSNTTSSGNSDPGMGWVLPVILALALAAALGIVLMRRRGGAPPGPA